MASRVFDFLALGFVVLLIYVMVRPRSKFGDLVDAFTDLMVTIARHATNLVSEGV